MSLVLDTSDMDLNMEPDLEYQDVSEFETAVEEMPDGQPVEAETLESDSPSEPPPPKAVDHDSRNGDDDDFRSRIWNAEMRCRGKEAIVEDLKEQLKFAKADYDDSVQSLRKLANEGYYQPTSEPVNSPVSAQESASEVAEVAETVASDESWRSRSMAELLNASDISGLGAKKIELLTDLYPTFGDFQDLRCQASIDGKPLKDVLPNGFGEKVTDQIEEAFLNAIGTPLSNELEPVDQPAPWEGELDSNDETPESVDSVNPVNLDDL
jgi:hypothetical protein